MLAVPTPKMGRPESVCHAFKIVPVHNRLLKLLARDWIFRIRDTEISKNLLSESLGKFAIVFFDEGYTLFTRDLLVPNFLCCIIGRTANPEFYVGGVVMEIIDFVIDAVVLAVCPGGSLRRNCEVAMLCCVVVLIAE